MKPENTNLLALEAKDSRIKELEENKDRLRSYLSILTLGTCSCGVKSPRWREHKKHCVTFLAKEALAGDDEEDPTPPQICSWELFDDEWKLMVAGRGHAASVWLNGAWHTWNPHGVGGENSSEETVAKAKIEAAASAIAQGFI